MEQEYSTAAHIGLFAFIAELGDKSFFLVVILAAWCPLFGQRGGDNLMLQQALVGAGALVGLLMRSVLLVVGLNPLGGSMDLSLSTATVAVLLMLAAKSLIDLRKIERRGKSKVRGGDAAISETHGGAFPSPTFVPVSPPLSAGLRGAALAKPGDPSQNLLYGGFMGSFKAYDPHSFDGGDHGGVGDESDVSNPFAAAEVTGHSGAGYGTSLVAGPPPPLPPLYKPVGASGDSTIVRGKSLTQELPSSDVVSLLVAAFVIPCAVVFMAYSGDKSQLLLRESLHGRVQVDILFGTLLGYFFAVLSASFVGFLLERQVSDRRTAFIATVGLFAMALVAASWVIVGIETRTLKPSAAGAVMMANGTHTVGFTVATPTVKSALLAISEFIRSRRT